MCKHYFPIILFRQPISCQRPIITRYFIIRPALMRTFTVVILHHYYLTTITHFSTISYWSIQRCPKKDFEFSEANSLFFIRTKTKIDEAQYSYYLKVLSLKMFGSFFCKWLFKRNIDHRYFDFLFLNFPASILFLIRSYFVANFNLIVFIKLVLKKSVAKILITFQ